MDLPAQLPTFSSQDFSGVPSIHTVHAAQISTPQPYLVPVNPSSSRSTQRRGVLGSELTW